MSAGRTMVVDFDLKIYTTVEFTNSIPKQKQSKGIGLFSLSACSTLLAVA